MENRWTQLEAWVDANAPGGASELRPPATETAVADAEAELGVDFPPSVRASYLVHDGETATAWGVLGHRLLPLSNVVGQARRLREIDEDFDDDFWSDSLIPVLAVTNGDYLCVSDAPDGAETPLQRWDHEQSSLTELDPSFAAYFDGVIDAYEAGEYSYDPDEQRLRLDGAR